MRYLTESKFRKYVKRYSFLSFARKSGDKYGKKLMDPETKTGIDAAKTVYKRVVQKTAEATDFIGNIKEPIKLPKKVEKIYIPPEKIQQIIDDLKLF